jgi:hypothetical protein
MKLHCTAFKKKQEQTEKKCETCGHYCGYDNKFKCDIKGVLCIERDRWMPKQKQIEKSCKTCGHMYMDDDGDECCDIHGGCGGTYKNWIPQEKQDAPEDDVKVGDMVRTIKERDECVANSL